MTTEPNNVKKLQQRNYNLVVENEFLKDENNRLNEFCTYWEKQYNELKQENSQLKRQIEKLKLQEEYLMQSDKIKCESIYELKNKKELLKEANEKLKEQIDTSKTSRLIAENNRLNEICIYWEREHDVLAEENEIISQEITQLKHKNNAQAKTIDRLINIITDEHYN